MLEVFLSWTTGSGLPIKKNDIEKRKGKVPKDVHHLGHYYYPSTNNKGVY